GYLEEALDTFKYLLFMNPKDKYFAEQVKKLEDDLLVGHKKLSLDQLIKAPDLPQVTPPVESVDDDWVQVDFNKPSKPSETLENKTESSEDEWVMEKQPVLDHPIL